VQPDDHPLCAADFKLPVMFGLMPTQTAPEMYPATENQDYELGEKKTKMTIPKRPTTVEVRVAAASDVMPLKHPASNPMAPLELNSERSTNPLHASFERYPVHLAAKIPSKKNKQNHHKRS